MGLGALKLIQNTLTILERQRELFYFMLNVLLVCPQNIFVMLPQDPERLSIIMLITENNEALLLDISSNHSILYACIACGDSHHRKKHRFGEVEFSATENDLRKKTNKTKLMFLSLQKKTSKSV